MLSTGSTPYIFFEDTSHSISKNKMLWICKASLTIRRRKELVVAPLPKLQKNGFMESCYCAKCCQICAKLLDVYSQTIKFRHFFLTCFYNFYVLPEVFWKISWANFMTGEEHKILKGLSNTVSLVIVTVIDYWIKNIYFWEIYFNTKLVMLKMSIYI